MNLREMMDKYSQEGLTSALAASRVCQDIVLKALSEGPLSRNVTIKGAKTYTTCSILRITFQRKN